jgi:hypothetical protein
MNVMIHRSNYPVNKTPVEVGALRLVGIEAIQSFFSGKLQF